LTNGERSLYNRYQQRRKDNGVANTQTVVNTKPACDFGCGKTAEYDGMTKMGPWAYMCQSCFDVNGLGELGLGKGQRLVVKEA
jgi:hypothetical protein